MSKILDQVFFYLKRTIDDKNLVRLSPRDKLFTISIQKCLLSYSICKQKYNYIYFGKKSIEKKVLQ